MKKINNKEKSLVGLFKEHLMEDLAAGPNGPNWNAAWDAIGKCICGEKGGDEITRKTGKSKLISITDKERRRR